MTLAEQIHAILGCEWGVKAQSIDDTEPCTERAVQIVALHPVPGDPSYVEMKLCQRHLDVVMAHSTPTEEAPT